MSEQINSKTIAQFDKIFKRIEPLLDKELKAYFRSRRKGGSFDPIKESEGLLTYLTVFVHQAIEESDVRGTTVQEIARLVGELRMGLKDLEDMKRRRADWSSKHDDGRVVDPTRESALGRFESIHRQHSSE